MYAYLAQGTERSHNIPDIRSSALSFPHHSGSQRENENKLKNLKKKKKALTLFLSFSISFYNMVFQHSNEMLSHRYKNVKKCNGTFHTKLSLL